MAEQQLLEALVEAARAVAERKARERDERRRTMRVVSKRANDDRGEAA